MARPASGAAGAALVLPGERARLQEHLAAVARGEALLIQAADRAWPGGPPVAARLGNLLTALSQAATVLSYAAGVPVVRLLHSDAADEEPAATLNLARALTRDGRPGVPEAHAANQRFVASSPRRDRYAPLIREIDAALRFMRAHGVRRDPAPMTDLFAGRTDAAGHLTWLDARTADRDDDVVARVAGAGGPVGVTLGPDTTSDVLLALVDRLDPERSAGRLTFLTRLGAAAVHDVLPDLLGKVAASGALAVWACDPWHANAVRSPDGGPRWDLDAVLAEARAFAEAHRASGTYAGGLHLEAGGGPAAGGAAAPLGGTGGPDALLELAFQLAEFYRSP
ncbi:3-deoxy-7-phosphoheptulonate synthase [Streptomyces sp. NPDC053542]|uniref:3-deoxy-7-phosphoheptulonate synthase n=1 Tax=Streptomyces sp. NPDC053542 TaxID=3365710 RepID=UPI0037CD6F9F